MQLLFRREIHLSHRSVTGYAQFFVEPNERMPLTTRKHDMLRTSGRIRFRDQFGQTLTTEEFRRVADGFAAAKRS